MSDYKLYLIILGLIIYALGIAALIYIIVLARNLSKSAKSISRLIESNRENIDKALKDFPVISSNLSEITSLVKEEAGSVHNALSNLSETFKMTAASIKSLNHDVLGNLRSIIQLIRLVMKVFSKKKPGDL